MLDQFRIALSKDPESTHNCIQLKDSVIFQNHTFIVRDLFRQTLYNLLKLYKYERVLCTKVARTCPDSPTRAHALPSSTLSKVDRACAGEFASQSVFRDDVSLQLDGPMGVLGGSLLCLDLDGRCWRCRAPVLQMRK